MFCLILVHYSVEKKRKDPEGVVKDDKKKPKTAPAPAPSAAPPRDVK